jgi:hypothetical protein
MAQGNGINWVALNVDTNYAPGLLDKLQFDTNVEQPKNLSTGTGRVYKDEITTPTKKGP